MSLPRSRMMPVHLVLMLCVVSGPVCASAAPSGQKFFAAQCAKCHGDKGQGTDKHATPLEGDLSVAQLAEVIRETMPEDNPGTLSAEQSKVVAEYVHSSFYSPIARERNRPARIELARLTVRQYRNAVADLIGSFDRPAKWGDERGLIGEFYNNRRPSNHRERVARRVDPQVDFDFGTEPPLPETSDPRVFSIRWTGSVLAPETGEYEFIVKTDHAARLWINNDDAPAIDAWVKSGDDTEFKASQYLIGGRSYLVRLEFSKAKQGVDDSDKQKEKPPVAPAFVKLCWKRPRGAVEVIPARHLSTEEAPEAFVCDVPFPPDDRSYGWERGTAVSKAWDDATTNAAIATASYVSERLDKLAGTKADAPDRDAKLRKFCTTFVERAFRRPLTDELQKKFIDLQFDETDDPEMAVQRSVLLTLKSPRFLFREVEETGDAHDVAARLSFGFWDSIPDRDLRRTAQSNGLGTADQVRKHAERMLGDERAKGKLRNSLLSWLHVDTPADLRKNSEKFPEFDDAAIADLWTSLELFLDEVLSSDDADYRQLLLENELPLNGRLAKFFGTEQVPEAGFESIKLDDGHRAGVLTHPYLMARFAYDSESSPIHRGVFLARGVMGKPLRAPPEAFTPLAPELHPDLTTRERVTLQTQADNCMSCHRIINPLGFTLERFDAVGRLRAEDRSKAVDDMAEYPTESGATVKLRGARELAEFLASSEECHEAFVEQLFHSLVQQPVRAYGPETLPNLRQSFAENNFNIRKLAVEIMVATALQDRHNKGVETTAAKQ